MYILNNVLKSIEHSKRLSCWHTTCSTGPLKLLLLLPLLQQLFTQLLLRLAVRAGLRQRALPHPLAPGPPDTSPHAHVLPSCRVVLQGGGSGARTPPMA